MTAICTANRTASPHQAALANASRSLARLLLWPLHVARARRELAQLSHFSEYELRDIGLSSQDLRNATALPLDADPTNFLARRAAENHHRQLS